MLLTANKELPEAVIYKLSPKRGWG